VLGDATLTTAPPYEWPTRTTAPGIDLTNATIVPASAARLRNGFGGAYTVRPAACSCAMTPFQQDASAHAPCTNTMAGFELSDGRSNMKAYLESAMLSASMFPAASGEPRIALHEGSWP
jgi:hypothetical protein